MRIAEAPIREPLTSGRWLAFFAELADSLKGRWVKASYAPSFSGGENVSFTRASYEMRGRRAVVDVAFSCDSLTPALTIGLPAKAAGDSVGICTVLDGDRPVGISYGVVANGSESITFKADATAGTRAVFHLCYPIGER